MEAQVFGVPDPRMGEEVACWIGLKDGQSISEKELRAFCKEKVRKSNYYSSVNR